MIYTGGRKNGYLLAARVKKAHGLKGFAVVTPLGSRAERFLDLSALYSFGEGGITEHRIQKAEIHGDELWILFDGVKSREDAETLRSLELYTAKADAPVMDADEYLIADLIGMEVRGSGEELLGHIRSVECHGAADVYDMETTDSRTLMFPAIKRVVLRVDTEKRIMQVDTQALSEVCVYAD